MKQNNSIMKKLLFFLTLMACGMSLYAYNYHFSATTSGNTLYYSITDYEEHYVMLVSPRPYGMSVPYEDTEKPTGKVLIPSTVTYNGVTYTVTSIDYWGFGGCSDITSVTIPNTVTSIGACAFQDCGGLLLRHCFQEA